MQASLAVVGCAAAIGAWLSGAGRWWLVAAVLLGGVVPFTLVVLKPVNDALFQGGNFSTVELGAVLSRWGYLSLDTYRRKPTGLRYMSSRDRSTSRVVRLVIPCLRYS